MALFEIYDPGKARKSISGVLNMRHAHPEDQENLGQLYAQRHQISIEEARNVFSSITSSNHGNFFIAEVDQELVAYAKTHYFIPPSSAPHNCVPEGWYLMGLIVKHCWRRHGIGQALTHYRNEKLISKTPIVYFFTNSLNLVSISLHTQMGFKKLQDNIWYPGVHFSGTGKGILYAKDLS